MMDRLYANFRVGYDEDKPLDFELMDDVPFYRDVRDRSLKEFV